MTYACLHPNMSYVNLVRFETIKENIKEKHEQTILYYHSGLKDSIFLESIHQKCYKIYENELETTWYV